VPTLLSHLFLRTLREDPSDAEVTSHRLLLRAGYIRRQAPGIFAWLPLGLRVKAKVERIIREEMAAAGAQEVHFPALLPKEPYEATGRWDEYGDGIFRLKDRKDADYLLAPTHEEAFTLLVKDLYTSYKDLPVCLYQIQDKYRDEARPRAGLLRGREFTMKDAYSFDVTDEGLAVSYQAQRDAYERIFARLGLDYVIVQADAGAMGGSRSEEFLHPTEVGEDSFVSTAAGYAANVEAFRTVAPPAESIAGKPAAAVVSTPGAGSIEQLVLLMNASHPREGSAWHAADALKNVVLALTHLDGTRELVVVGLPGDREVDLGRVEVFFAPAAVEPATDADFAKSKNLVRGFIGPWSEAGQFLGERGSSKIRYFVDPRVVEGSAWLTGANVADAHVTNVVIGRDVFPDGLIECSDVRDGDPAPDGSGPVSITRGMEIGHVFQLGRKYAEALGLKVQDEDGKLATVTMGSYGIGVTRILAVVAETNNDDKGLIWPPQVSPFDIHVIATGKDDDVFGMASQLSADLEATGLEVLLDDRPKVSPGVKFGDAELVGIPTILIVGKGLAEGLVEVWDRRTDKRTQVPVAEAVTYLTGS
jgi:prolyl-tRNA synthetase